MRAHINREDEADIMHLLAMRLPVSAQRRRVVTEEIARRVITNTEV